MGSEMCIRDSLPVVHLLQLLAEEELPVHRQFWYKLASATLIITCLLYTSDAADERSSVDLGGRRIIKKKTSAIITASENS